MPTVTFNRERNRYARVNPSPVVLGKPMQGFLRPRSGSNIGYDSWLYSPAL